MIPDFFDGRLMQQYVPANLELKIKTEDQGK